MNRQPLLIAASRCYLIQMLQCSLTCTNGCSCWSPNEENSPRVFLTMDALYRLSYGGQITVLQLGDDIVATTRMKRLVNPALISIQRRR